MNNTLNLPKLEEITQVYKHRKDKIGGCRCGCLGTYWVKDGSKKNERKIKEIFDVIMANIKNAEVTETYIDVWVEDRFFTMYFEEKSQTRV